MSTRTIQETDFHFPGQKSVYHGKVRDMYTIKDDYMVAVATDRISAFDVILPQPIPYKGQVLNQIAAYFLEATKDVAPNWFMNMPDPNASLGRKFEPVKVEMIVRGVLIGSAWRSYESGVREICGNKMPDGMQEFDAFPEPLVTPTTKADEGHDIDITPDEIVSQGLVTQAEWEKMRDLSLKLFAKGQEMARERGLLLADTKYEFGNDKNGEIYLIDEVHTADSSRYFYVDGYDAFLKDRSSGRPEQLSKEFLREWLTAHDFSGKPGQQVPDLPDDIVQQISDRYVALYECLTGRNFEKPSPSADPFARIETNVTQALENL